MMLSEERPPYAHKNKRDLTVQTGMDAERQSAHRDRRSHHCINATDDDFFTVAGDA